MSVPVGIIKINDSYTLVRNYLSISSREQETILPIIILCIRKRLLATATSCLSKTSSLLNVKMSFNFINIIHQIK